MTEVQEALRVLIVDDEPPARELLRSLLAAWPAAEIAGEASDGQSAVEMVHALAPDVVFLDVQMPRMSGFDVIATLEGGPMPLIVFVTAHDQYALRAFDVSACDYLLKPFDADRFAAAMSRVLARRRGSEPGLDAALRSLLAHIRQPAAEQLVVKSDGRHLFLNGREVIRVEADGKSCRIHLANGVVEVRESLTSLKRRLDPVRFVRVHRSAIVNRAHIREVQPWFTGEYVVLMRDGSRIVTGRSHREAVRRLIGG